MSDLHHVRIWLDKNGIGCRLEIDGKEVHGVSGIEVSIEPDLEPPRVAVELIPRTLEIEGDATITGSREIVFLPHATAEHR